MPRAKVGWTIDLRTFSRTNDVGPKGADLHGRIETTLNLPSQEYQERIAVHREQGNLPKVECCTKQMNQVFMNLLLNEKGRGGAGA